MNELPMIAKTAYGASQAFISDEKLFRGMGELERRVHAINNGDRLQAILATQPKKETPMSARIVRIFIADPNESIPLDKRVIYKSEEQLTDLTDQELFFEANPAALLAKHNEYRTTVVDRKTLGTPTVVNLEPARIRDLKMVVVDVAVF